MILIADSGSTKTDWNLITPDNKAIHIQSVGFNPFFQTADVIENALKNEVLPSVSGNVRHIFFYGAGCADEKSSLPVTTALARVFPGAALSVNSDMLAAARSLCGRNKGIANILGTGSNNCLYDGEKIISQIGSLGFWMGDEGSGGYLGKTLVKDYLLGELPQNLHHFFQADFPEIHRLYVLDRAYKQPFPNRYFASFTTFLSRHKEDPYCQRLLSDAFSRFLSLYVVKHPGANELPVSFSGSVGWYFKEELKQALEEKGLITGTIRKSPMEGLITYHLH